MKVGFFDVISIPGKVKSLEVPFEKEEICLQGVAFPVREKSMVHLKLAHPKEKILIAEGACEITVELPCDRCLSPVLVPLSLPFSHEFDMKSLACEQETEESVFVQGTDLDVDAVVELEAIASWPMKVLCRPDCKGLCPRCGQNLNLSPCSCQEEPKDPRMAAILDIFAGGK